ncbi:MAG: hypothetical protein ACYC1U_07150 [Candidatus Aquicultorales bacterium]
MNEQEMRAMIEKFLAGKASPEETAALIKQGHEEALAYFALEGSGCSACTCADSPEEASDGCDCTPETSG